MFNGYFIYILDYSCESLFDAIHKNIVYTEVLIHF